MKCMEASISWTVFTLSWLFLVVFLTKFLFSQLHKLNLKFPPGPKPWPIIGNLNLINGPLPHRSLHKLSQTYGPIMQLKFGSYPVVVASSAEMAKQFLKTHDHVFASRPRTAAGKYITYNYLNITWSPQGLYWRQGRKIFLTELFSSKRLESSTYIRVEELQAFISRLYALSGKPVMLRDHLSRLTLSIMSRSVMGKEYFREPEFQRLVMSLEEFQGMLDELFLLSGVFNIGDWIPWLDFFDLQGYVKRMKALTKKSEPFYDYVLNEHKAESGGVEDYVAKDMVDSLLQLVDDPDLEVKLTIDSVKAFIQDLIAGGTDTSATTLEWAMSELIKQPNLITRATEELDRVIGRDRWVEEKDIPQLPYIEAIMKETMRKHPAVVLLPPHLALEDCNVAGFDIRKGSRVFINTWSIGRDPSVWEAPEKFNPERFLENKGIDVRGQSFELLPFGSGRRMCPGYSLGLKVIGSCLANMLHGFNWKLPENMKIKDLGMEEASGLVTHRKFPLVAVLEPRLPVHLY
ncbi:trimethyltridecatetraene synthase-like [Argentina anserina]|uniref:trimethyltridecatetraene synthase-like n=1 Tax=Argentina anserina TaxID=57926 RepID=UPI00217636FE|nr:trimethyltridecatetraene synthase-like [Potentilla anserina]